MKCVTVGCLMAFVAHPHFQLIAYGKGEGEGGRGMFAPQPHNSEMVPVWRMYSCLTLWVMNYE